MGQVLDGSSRGLNTASMPADRAEANQRAGKIPNLIPAYLRDTPARKLGKALSGMASRQTRVRSSSSFKNTANRKNSQCTLMAQSPKTSQGGASSLSSKVRVP